MTDYVNDKNLPWLEMVIPNDLHAAAESERTIVARVESHGFSADATFAIRLAVEEALTNAIKHGNRNDPSRTVRIRYAVNARVAVICVRDEGPGFRPDDVPDPTSPDRIALPNGRGIMLMKAYMDDIVYREQGKEVVMVKVNS
jgi:serine/threonine-protein kinase RsbW